MEKTKLRNWLIGLFVLFLLLISFVAFSVTNGKKVTITTNHLAIETIPGLIAASNLKRAFQSHTIQLYELYATNDQENYKKYYAKNKADILIDSANLQVLPQFKGFTADIDKLSQQQEEVALSFVKVMQQPDIDWDAAREILAKFSAGTDQIEDNLDTLIGKVSKQSQDEAETTKALLAQLGNIGIIFVALLLLSLIAMLWLMRTQNKQADAAASSTKYVQFDKDAKHNKKK